MFSFNESNNAIPEIIQQTNQEPVIESLAVFYAYLSTLKALAYNATQTHFFPIESLQPSIKINYKFFVDLINPLTTVVVYDNKYCQEAYSVVKKILSLQAPVIDIIVAGIKGDITDFINELTLNSGDNLDVKDRFKGSLYGKFLGDFIGSKFENRHSKYDESKVYKHITKIIGYVTDDSEMTIATAYALIESLKGKLMPSKIAKWYGIWRRSNCPWIGSTTRKSLNCSYYKGLMENTEELFNTMKQLAKSLNQESHSNGSLMRISSVPMWAINNSSESMVDAIYTALSTTHSAQVVFDVSTAYCIALKELILSGNTLKALEETSKQNIPIFNTLIYPKLSKMPEEWNKIPGCIFSEHALLVAMSSLIENKSLLKTIVDAIMIHLDTDTDACIAGALVGARVGYSHRDSELPSVDKLRSNITFRPFYFQAAYTFDFICYILYHSINISQSKQI